MKDRLRLILEPGFADIDREQQRIDAERAARNRALWKNCITPKGASDIHVGDRVVPLQVHWQRGPGVVDEVDGFGQVWAVFGQREHPHHTDSKTVRCRTPWQEIRIVERG